MQPILAKVSEREEIKTFHIQNHLATTRNEQEYQSQSKDCPEDFPALYSDDEFYKYTFWILRNSSHELIGCIGFLVEKEDVGWISMFSVKQEERGKGWGKLLLDTAIQEAKQRHCKEIRLITLPEIMPSAVKLYTRRGFQTISSRKGHTYQIETMRLPLE